ncbi:MAG: tetratricopeptide repeat protein [Myxococcales bacterium]|nr:tetratricopeptide repeat protein [Myxococcales bacterium]
MVPSTSHRARLVLVAAALFFVATYVRAIDYEFVWDDRNNIHDNGSLHESLREALFRTEHDHIDTNLRKLEGLRPKHDSYRPVLHLSYRVGMALFGATPRAFRIHDMVLGLLNVFLVFAVVRRWLFLGGQPSEFPAAVAAALFAIHPIAVEPIVYVSGRGDLLAAFGALLCLYCALRATSLAGLGAWTRRAGWIGGSVLALAASFFSKEVFIALPAVILLMGWSIGATRRAAIPAGVLVLALVGLFLVRIDVAGAGGAGSAGDALMQLPNMGFALLRAMALPLGLSIGRGLPTASWVFGWGGLAAGGLLALVLQWRHEPRLVPLRIAVVGTSMAFLFLGPAAVVAMIMGELPDRYAYLSLFGFVVGVVVLFGFLVSEVPRLRILFHGSFLLWVGLLLFVNWMQVGTWRSNETLYEYAVLAEEQSAVSFYRLGVEYARQGRFVEAEGALARSLALDGSDLRAHNNMAVVLMNLGQPDRAEVHLRRVLQASSGTHYRAFYNLGLVQLGRGDRKGACTSFQLALRTDPNYGKAKAAFEQHCGIAPSAGTETSDGNAEGDPSEGITAPNPAR